MTNTQGQVPEALRLADEISKAGAFPAYPRAPYEAAAAELRRLHAQVAALTAAPQGVAYAELPEPTQDELRAIARKARDSSGSASDDCGSAAYVLYGWRAAIRAFNGQAPAPVLHLVHSAFAEVAMAFPKAFGLHKVGIADTAVREALAAPATAQAAESVPAIQGEMNVQLDIDSNHSAPGQQRDVARSVALGQPMGNGQDQAAGRPSAQGDKLLTVAERNIRSFLRSATFKSESDREAALNCVDVLWEAARAAESVLEDAARLDWLLLRISGAEFRRLGVHYSGNARRADVDAARKQGGA